MTHIPAATAAILSLAAFASAQSPLLTMTPAVSLIGSSTQVQWNLTGPIAVPHAILADVRGGPSQAFGETFLLGLSPALTTLHFALASGGASTGSFAVPVNPGLVGTIIYSQAALITPTAPNGIFEVANGASSVIHASQQEIVIDFADPVAQGFQGDFRDDIVGHIRGGAVTHRTHVTLDPLGAIFTQLIQSPLIPQGCREQMVFRASDLGATGTPEVVTGVSWLTDIGVIADSFLQFELRMGHTHVTPDYSVDPWSALAMFPGSGLSPVFAANELPQAPPQTVFLGRYDVDPTKGQLGPLGVFMPYPAIQPFAYDGSSSLLLDFLVTQGMLGVNGQKVQLMVQSGPLPAARAVAGSTFQNPMPIPNPGQVTQANVYDNAMPILQFEFARVETHALSPWIASPVLQPDYHAATVAASLPVGTTVQLRYRGSFFANGNGATAWSSSPDIADGMPFLQIDVALIGNPLTDEVPIVDTLVVPIN